MDTLGHCIDGAAQARRWQEDILGSLRGPSVSAHQKAFSLSGNALTAGGLGRACALAGDPEKAVDDMKQDFSLIDRNGDGGIDLAELTEILKMVAAEGAR